MTAVVAALAFGCHPFPTEPGLGVYVVSRGGGLDLRFVNCSDDRDVAIRDVMVLADGNRFGQRSHELLCGIGWQSGSDTIDTGQTWHYATVPRGYAKAGACEALQRPGGFVVIGYRITPVRFRLDAAGTVQAEPACRK